MRLLQTHKGGHENLPLLLPFPICILEKWNAFKQENKEQLLFPLPESHSPSTNSISEGGGATGP